MSVVLIAACLLAQIGAEAAAPADAPPMSVAEQLRKAYSDGAAKYAFRRTDGQELTLVEKPIMRWSNDNDWSGDVFVWTYGGRPEVVGCILSGPREGPARLVFHEFHSLAVEPLAPTDMATNRRWQPKDGLEARLLTDTSPPADDAKSRVTQMRRLARRFTAKMEADGEWDLRLLTQPLYRYEGDGTNVVDGALFAYVWTKGTDPEMIVLLECRKTSEGLAWHYTPVRFSNRSVWLQLDGTEVWRVEGHREPSGAATDLTYTTAYAGTISPIEPETEAAVDTDSPKDKSR